MDRDSAPHSLSNWAAEPRKAFDDWLTAQRFRGSSAEVYRAQWNHFIDWLAERGKHLSNAEPVLIDEFVATLDVKREQRARYLRIMERVFDDMAEDRPTGGNPARPVARAIDAPWAAARSNAPTGFLSVHERERLWEALRCTTDLHGNPLHWRDLRDRALAALLLGNGLKLSEAESLTLRCVSFENGTILIESNDPAERRYARTLPMDASAKDILACWLLARQAASVEGDLVFAAGRGGRTMHKATVLRAIDTLVEQAGLLEERTSRISPQTLRNAYAATLFEADADDALLSERLGFAQSISARRLRSAWQEWQRASADAAAVRAALAGSA